MRLDTDRVERIRRAIVSPPYPPRTDGDFVMVDLATLVLQNHERIRVVRRGCIIIAVVLLAVMWRLI